jgi:hypothetical protein
VSDRQAKRERAACDALSTLVRDFVTSELGAPPGGEEELAFRLAVRVRPHRDQPWDVAFDPPLVDQLREQIEEVGAEWGAYEEGHVYCFRCQSAACEHGLPPSPLMVFSGYAAHGVPQWHEMTQALLDARDERVDRLFAGSEDVVSLLRMGRELKAEQLSSFGRASRTYALLGQVAAGYLSLDASGRKAETARRRLAVTLQAVETRSPDGRFALRLNRVACVPGGGTLGELFDSEWAPWLKRSLQQAEAGLAEIERQALAARARDDTKAFHRTLGRIPALLRQLAASIDRGDRQSSRRTRHVEQRRREHRPVHMAVQDARDARPEDFFFDERTDAVVVRGAHARMHVFTPEGRHVTSFKGHAGTSSFRVRTHRWRVLDEPARESFAARLAGTGR